MQTEKLYYEDPFLREFPATVQTCEPAKDGWRVSMNCTAFYPEGGGQPADHGTLGGVRVTDVHERDGVIFHTCDGPVEPGATVIGTIDWARRFDHMQQHSGEHIISGVLCRLYHCDNVGFHLGAETVTIDYNTDISWEQALEAERLANQGQTPMIFAKDGALLGECLGFSLNTERNKDNTVIETMRNPCAPTPVVPAVQTQATSTI